jgi:Putative lumazine-binding
VSRPARRTNTTAAVARDRAAIVRVVADYYESWFAGDHERMRSSLHPDLAKRSVEHGAGGDPFLHTIGAQDMVEATARGAGKKYPRGHDVVICDIDEDLATVKVTSTPYVEYLHLARFGECWLIINVLWRRRGESAAAG